MSIKNADAADKKILLLKEKERQSFSEALYLKRKEIYKRESAKSRCEPAVITAANCLSAFLREKELILSDEDLLAGHHQYYDYSYSRPASVEEEITKARGCEGINAEDAALLDIFERGFQTGLYGRASGGHIIPGYERVLKLGLGKLSDIAGERAADAKSPGAGFAAASLIVCRAAADYCLRYAAEAKRLADECEDIINRDNMNKISSACEWISSSPPRSFFEALQLICITHEIIICEQLSGSFSFGRLDQYLYPYYKKDTSCGRMGEAEAARLIEAFWIKLGGLKKGYQNVTLGGCGAQGGCAVNELSYLCLRASKKLKMDQPLLSVRWTPDMPGSFWEEVQELIEAGLGFPALFNDGICIRSKMKSGVPAEDARNYGIIGCVEIAVPEKERSDTEGLRINWAKILELMLNRGRCAITGKEIKLKRQRELPEIRDFDEFYGWYREELSYFTDIAVKGYNIIDRNYAKFWPSPFLSSTMYGCIEKGLDAAEGGTYFSLSPLNGCGMANTADSLAAVKKIVYDDRLVTLAGMSEILRNDFQGGGQIWAEASKRCPKYGTDNDTADDFMRELVALFCDKADGSRNIYGGVFIPGFYTVEWHAFMGRYTGALPDGRKSGTALSNGLSSVQGADSSGPTALIKSASKLNHARFGNGMVLDIKFHPSFFREKTHRDSFRNLIETYFKLGGMEIQINVVSNETLKKAQKNPAGYGDLIVRVSGFSAYFVELDRILQDEIIARTEHGQF